MNLAKTIRIAFALALFLAGELGRAEEQHSILTPLSETTLSGYVDTSANWWVGTLGIPNDSARNAIDADARVSIPTNLTNSTLEAGEPAQPRQTGSIWYKWAANQTGVARISTAAIPPMPTPAATSTLPALSEESIFYPWGGVSYGGGGGSVTGVIITGPPFINPVSIGYYRWSTDLAVYRAIQVSESELKLEFVQRGASLQFDAHAGETFWIAVEVYENQPEFAWQLELPSPLPGTLFFDLTAPPANDSFASAFSVAGSAGGTLVGYALAATSETGEPDLGGEFSGGSVWFHFTAAMYGTIAISDVSQNLPIAIFTGSTVSDLKLVAKSSAGGIAFFGEQGKVYHIAVYHGASTAGFYLSFIAPSYRVYETTLEGLFPGGAKPHLYGLRGRMMLLYAKTALGWDLLEVEPIIDQAADLKILPANPAEGKLRVLTVDEAFPSPHVEFAGEGGSVSASLVGIPGQTSTVSYSTDLVNWSEPQVITLEGAMKYLRAHDPVDSNYFYRVTQTLPQINSGGNVIGVVQTQIGGGAGGVPPPPVPPGP